ncbi:MAG: hypothetical protein M1508_09870 [Nitrospirae bacterium]|nr:hypothetical protein [Nitrospirota bacterium]MCL5421138.1 hypothetical protein [Nitrospirota bacterium]
MKLRILLVNPWIYDFTAYNLRARPLDLLNVGEHLRAFLAAAAFTLSGPEVSEN